MPDLSFFTFKDRVRTICIDINGAKPWGKATWQEWTDFLLEDLKVDPTKVEWVNIHTLTGLLMLQLTEEEYYLQILERARAGVQWTSYPTTVFGIRRK